MKKYLGLAILAFAAAACHHNAVDSGLSDMEKWKLGWRMVDSSWDENYQLGEAQFDSLLAEGENMELPFLLTGLEILKEVDKKEKLLQILKEQDQETLREVCSKNLFTQKLPDVELCRSANPEEISNPEVQMELIKMYVADQAVRGNIMEGILTKYNLDKTLITNNDGIAVDARNRERLIQIMAEFGFPTKRMVGKDAMLGTFLIIQHADGDTEWQKAQLPAIEQAVKNGDLEGQSYAMLYDRIKVNGGEKQRYGTQFSNVDRVAKTVELAQTEDIGNLDQRRMEMGLMPIEMYKKLMLKNL